MANFAVPVVNSSHSSPKYMPASGCRWSTHRKVPSVQTRLAIAIRILAILGSERPYCSKRSVSERGAPARSSPWKRAIGAGARFARQREALPAGSVCTKGAISITGMRLNIFAGAGCTAARCAGYYGRCPRSPLHETSGRDYNPRSFYILRKSFAFTGTVGKTKVWSKSNLVTKKIKC